MYLNWNINTIIILFCLYNNNNNIICIRSRIIVRRNGS